MIFHRRRSLSIGSSPRPINFFLEGATLPQHHGPIHDCERTMWPDHRLLKLIQTEFPIVQAPMAGVMDADLVIAAAQGGALGSLPCAMLSVEKAREQVHIIRQRVSAPVNMNFFCHKAFDAD